MDDRERERRFRRKRREEMKRKVLIQADTIGEILHLLKTSQASIQATLAGAPSDFETWRISILQAEIRRAMEVFERGTTDALMTGLDRSWGAGSDLVLAPLAAGGIDLSARLPALDPRLLLALKAFQTDRVKDISTTVVNKINQELSQAVIGVQSPYDAVRKVAEHMEAPASRAGMIVRTELGTAYSEATQQRMEQARKLGVDGLQKQWRRSGKLHPRITHDLADGQIVDVDKPFLVGGIEIPKPRDPSIPLGERLNCGCTSLPYMRHWRVSTHGPKPYTAEELATSPTARQVEEVRTATPVLSRVLSQGRVVELRQSLAATTWGRAMTRGERMYGLTDEEALALHAYSFVREAGGTRDVNGALRSGNEATSPYGPLIALQRAGLEKLPIVAGDVTRYLRTPSAGLLEATLGAVWTDPGFLSCTQAPEVLEPYFSSMAHIMLIRSHTGRDFAALSTFPQAEVIFRPGTPLRVLERSGDSNGATVELEELI